MIGADARPPFLSRRSFWAALALASALPFIVSPFPMMADWFSHVGRYHVMLRGAQDAFLPQYYDFHWALIGNLGIDLLMVPLGPLLGTEQAARLCVGLIPPLTVGGIYALGRSGRGAELAPGAFLALPLVFARNFTLGFTNFCLATALALWTGAAWAWAAERPAALRWAVAAPAALLVWLAHIGGWAILLVLVGGMELARAYRISGFAPTGAWRGALRLAPFFLPLAPTLAWRSGAAATSGEPHQYLFGLKWVWLRMLVRGEIEGLDLLTSGLLLGAAVLLLILLILRRASVRAGAAVAALCLGALFLALPQWVLGSYYADMRLLAPALILVFLAITPASPGIGRLLVGLGLALFAAQVVATSVGWHRRGAAASLDLKVLDRVPRGARIAAFSYRGDCLGWAPSGLEHLPSLAIVRRSAFVNSEFAYAGQNLMQPIYNRGRDFNGIPSNLIAGPVDPCGGRPLRVLLDALPRDRFDYVWLFDAVPPQGIAWLQPVAAGPHGRLYRLAAR